MHDRRNILYHPAHIETLRRVLAKAKVDLHDQHFQHLCQIADLNVEVTALRVELTELRQVVLLLTSIRRSEAETDVATLRQQLLTVLARLERRDPTVRLN